MSKQHLIVVAAMIGSLSSGALMATPHESQLAEAVSDHSINDSAQIVVEYEYPANQSALNRIEQQQKRLLERLETDNENAFERKLDLEQSSIRQHTKLANQ